MSRGRSLVAASIAAGTRYRLLGVLTGLLLAAITYVIILSVNGVPFQERHALTVELPKSAPPIDVADQVRVGGQRAGVVSASSPTTRGARIELKIDPDFWPLPDQTAVRLRVKPASGLAYVELTPAGTGELAENATIPSRRVSAGATLPEAAEAFDLSTREALSRTAVVSGAALAGNGEKLGGTIDDLTSAVRNGTPLLETIAANPGDISAMLADGRIVARALAGDGELQDLITGGSQALRAVAQSSPQLGEAIELSPGLEAQVTALAPQAERVLADSAELMRELDPLAADIAAQLPAMRRLLSASGDLRASTKVLAAATADVLAQAPQAMVALRAPVIEAGPAANALTPIGEELDKYRSDMLAGVKGLEAVTSKIYPDGATAPNNPALRFAPVFTCHTARNPYPDPGQSVKDKAPRKPC